jgi:hypothetical protein
MQEQQQLEKPVRVGVFSSLETAKHAIEALIRAGFTRQQLAVLAPESIPKEELAGLLEANPSRRTAEGVAAGSAIGAVLGGLAGVAGLATMGGVGILVAGGALEAGVGGVVGGLIGGMTMRGMEKEYADYYDQSLSHGRILVAVETHNPTRLALAERLLAEAGAEPVPLPEG